MKILITGATGFIGNNVLKKIVVKYSPEKVIALSSQNIAGIKTIPSKGYDFDKNYLKENGCYDVEVLMHIGSFTPKSLAHVDNMEETTMNIVNTQNLLKSDLPFLKKIVFISTIDVYAHISEPLTELTDTNPSGLYGWSKLYCEQLVLKHCIKNHLDYEILRLGHVYGEGEEKYQKAMPIMIKRAIEGKKP